MSLHRLALVLLMAVGSPIAAAAQGTTAFYTGEQTTGMTKQCFYDALGNPYTITVSSIKLCPQSIKVQTNPSRSPSAPSYPEPPRPSTITAFKTGEQTTGMTKQCYYDGLGNTYTKTMRSIDICPNSIQVRR